MSENIPSVTVSSEKKKNNTLKSEKKSIQKSSRQETKNGDCE